MGVFAISGQAGAKNAYWLSGVSKAAGGQMNMYYKGNTIVLKGKIKKSASWEKVYDAAEKNYAIAVQMVKGISVGDVFSI